MLNVGSRIADRVFDRTSHRCIFWLLFTLLVLLATASVWKGEVCANLDRFCGGGSEYSSSCDKFKFAGSVAKQGLTVTVRENCLIAFIGMNILGKRKIFPRGSTLMAILFVLVMAKFNTVNATLNAVEWRWLSGSSNVNQNGVCGTAGQYAVSYTPGARRWHSMTPTYESRLYLFGGDGYPTVGYPGSLGDLWVYRQTSWNVKGEWAWLGGKSDQRYYSTSWSGIMYPAARSVAILWYSPGDSKVYIHGGVGSVLYSDMWSFDTVSYTWSVVQGSSVSYANMPAVFGTKNIFDAGNTPGSMSSHMLLTNKADGTDTRIFGGSGYITATSGDLSDTWRYNKAINQWVWLNGISTLNAVGNFSNPFMRPGGRTGSATMGKGSYVYLYGGYGYSSTHLGYLADLWSYNLDSNEWSFIAGTSDSTSISALYRTYIQFSGGYPGTRSSTASWTDPNADLVHIFGGSSLGSGYYNDLWSFNTTTRLWSWTGGASATNQLGTYGNTEWYSTSNIPGNRINPSGSVNGELGLMYLFGGLVRIAGIQHRNDFWATKGPTIIVGAGPTPVPTSTPTLSPTPTTSPSPSASHTATPTVTTSPSPTATPTVTTSPTPTWDPSVPTPTTSPTVSPTASPTTSPSASPSTGPTTSPSPTAIPAATASSTISPTPTSSPSPPTTPPAGTGASGSFFGNPMNVLAVALGGGLGFVVLVGALLLFATKPGKNVLKRLQKHKEPEVEMADVILDAAPARSTQPLPALTQRPSIATKPLASTPQWDEFYSEAHKRPYW